MVSLRLPWEEPSEEEVEEAEEAGEEESGGYLDFSTKSKKRDVPVAQKPKKKRAKKLTNQKLLSFADEEL